MSCQYCNDTSYIDNIFIVGDLSQAEARVVAELLKRCGYPKLHNLYKYPEFDIHKWAAAPIFNCSIDEVTKYQRGVGKLSNHSGNYGAGPRVLVDKALKDGLKGINYQTAKRILEIRHEQLPGLRQWWKDVEKKLRQTRILTTCFGRRRIFFGRLDEQTFREAYSYEPQSTVGDACNTIFRTLWKVFRQEQHESNLHGLSKSTSYWDSFLLQRKNASFRPVPLIQVHDEVVVRCPNIPELVEYAIKEFRKAANIELWINKDEPLIIPIDLKIGPNWKDTEDVLLHS